MMVPFIFILLLCSGCRAQGEESTSVIDLLSSDSQFSTFLRHLQRSGLIPDLNIGSNNTVIAPINDAFQSDNDGEFLIKYHLSPVLIDSEHVKESRHLIYPSWLESTHGQSIPMRVDYTTTQHQPHIEIFNSRVVKPDWKATNGIIQVVDSIITPPPSPCDLLQSSWAPYRDMYNPSNYSHFLDILQALSLCHDDSDSLVGSTFFLPTDSVMSTILNEIELDYLKSQHGQADADFFIGAHVSPTLTYRQDLANSTSKLIHTMIDGRSLNLSKSLQDSSSYVMVVNDSATCFETDLIANDGVVHLINSSLVSYNELNFTPLKYIYGLGCDEFGQELEFRKIALSLASDSSINQTIFVPSNDGDDDDDDDYSISSSKALLNTLKYHFVEGQVDISKQKQLMISKAQGSHLAASGQRVQLVNKDNHLWLNGESEVIAGPFSIGNTTIYRISLPLNLPGSARSTLAQISHSSISYWYLKQWTHLIGEKSHDGLTFFLPSNKAWKRLKMVRDLLEDDTKRLGQVMKGMILNEPIYTDKCNGTYETLEGTNMTVQCDGHKKMILGTGERSLPVNIDRGDILLNTGVAHLIDEVPLPDDLIVTPRDLLRSVHAKILPDLLDARNLSYVLGKNESFSILAPLDRSLRYDNITENSDFIDTILKLHVIKTNPFEDFLNGSSFETLAGWKVSASEVSNKLYQLHFTSLGITVQLRVLNEGRTSSGGMVYIIDREIFPDWLIKDSGSHIRTWIALLLGGVIGIILLAIALCLSLCVTVFGGRKKLQHQQQQDDDETSPLLLPPGSQLPPQSSTHNSGRLASQLGSSEERNSVRNNHLNNNNYNTAGRRR